MSLSLKSAYTKAFILLAIVANSACSSSAKVFDNVAPFQQISSDHAHVWDDSVHPFTGAAVIDIDGDGKQEVFVGGSQDQNDALLSLKDGKLVDISNGLGISSASATYGSLAIDIDNDRDTDLLVARESGLSMYLNQDGKFGEQVIPVKLPKDSVIFGIAASDIERDGDADLYLSVFVNTANFRSAVFNDPSHAKTNIMLLNNGDLTFSDITESSGAAGKQNTFLSVFADLNNDGFQDLLVSQNTGEIEMFRNNGDLTFTPIPTNSGYGFWMGVAIADIDNDGDQDMYFSNAGDSIPAFLTTGDIGDDQRHNLEWLLLRNDGDFEFTDVTEEYGITGEGFAWGAVFEDLNFDGHMDLLVAQNYIKWPIHKLFPLAGKSYLQDSDSNTFIHTENLGIENPYFGQSPVIADLDGDTKPDVLWINMNGPIQAFLNQSSDDFFVVNVEDSAASLGTRVTLITNEGKTYTREVISNTGLLTDHSPHLVFGLGGASVEEVVITRPDGTVETLPYSGKSINL